MLKTVSLPAWGLLVLVAGAIIYFSARPVYRFHGVNEAMVIVSFKHNTEKLHACTEEEISAYRDDDKDRRPHMRKRDDSCGGREKAPLSLRLTIDGATAVDNLYEPSGFRNDGSIHVYEPFMTSAGMRTVKVEMIEQREGAPVTHQWEEGLAIAPGQIILLDFNNGFFLHR